MGTEQWLAHKIGGPTVTEKFNTYRFADHKERVIALLQRVCTVGEGLALCVGCAALLDCGGWTPLSSGRA